MNTNNELPAIFQALNNKDYQTEATGMAQSVQNQANAVISELSLKYPSWAMGDVLKLKRCFNDAHSVSGEARTKVIKEELYPIVHDIKGQGTTFGYPLMTDVAAYVCEFIKTHDLFEHDDMNIIREKIDAFEMILNEKLAGDGGQTGTEIRVRLRG